MIAKKDLDSSSIFHPELFKGKVAIITGGSNGGMLSEIAKAYLKHGAKAVGLVARNVDKLKKVVDELSSKQLSGKIHAIQGDVRDPKSCAAAAKVLIDLYGQIDILVNGAAGNFLASASKLSSNGFKTVLEIDTLGTFNMSQAVFKAGMANKGGVIINISATLHWNGSALQAHSAAAKAGVDALTRVLAVEWGPHNIRVVGIVPGAIAGTEGVERLMSVTNMNNRKATEQAAAEKTATKNVSNVLAFAALPILRLGEVEDIANAAIYLASPAAAYMTGVNIVLDGGVHLTAPNFIFNQKEFVEMWSKAKL